MADYFIKDSTLKSIADAIRVHTGNTGDLYPNAMAGAIRNEFQNTRQLIERTRTTITHNGITSIGPYAFYNYSGLEAVVFPNCSSVDSTAFSMCTNIKNITFGLTELTGTNFPLDSTAATTLETAAFPSCSTIGHNGLYGCTAIKEVYLPVCTTASSTAFAYRKTLQSVTIGLSEFTSADNVFNPISSTITTIIASNCITVDKSAFAINYTKLASISFPACVSLKDHAFDNCVSLTSVSFPVCTTVASYAFTDCIGLSTINLPVCTSIGASAFYSCSNLTSINCPNCRTIDTGAFIGCSSLSAIDLPNCTQIGYSAFYNCTHLTTVVLSGSSVPLLDNVAAFANTPITNSSYIGDFGSVYVPASLVSKYKIAANWIDIADRITEIGTT